MIFPALFKQEFADDATREQNIAIAKEQLEDLELRYNQKDIDIENYQSTKEELERSLFNDLKESDHETLAKSQKGTNKKPVKFIDTWLVLLLVPLIAIPVYLNLGNLNFTKQLDSKKVSSETTNSTMPLKPDGTPDIEKVTERLQQEMEKNPTDPKGWYMLGRAYMLTQSYPEAIESFDKSLSLRPDLAETMLSLADALSMNNNGHLIGRPRELVKKALQIEPQNMTGLWLSGMAASQESEYLEAITQWQKVLTLLDDKPDEKEAIKGLIAEAESRLKPEMKKQLLGSSKIDQKKEDLPQTKNKTISVKVSLPDRIKKEVSPNDSVFIYAKAMSGPPMPLAAVRKQVKDFPLELELNDDSAMMPDLKLSAFDSVIVGARISKSGQPVAQNGDFYIEKNNVNLGDSITLEINQIYKK